MAQTVASAPSAAHGARVAPTVASVGRAADGTLIVSGTQRSYRLYVPASLPRNAPVPLLIAMHGGLGSGAQFELNSGFDALAETNRFIVVYPNGTPISPGSRFLVWNGGGCCSVAAQNRENVDDVAFISALIDHLEGQYRIDSGRVYATGHSNGAILAERLACELSDKIVAIGVQAGDLFIDRCRPTRPVAVLEIHGTADQNLPIDGGVGTNSLTRDDFPPPVDGLRTLAAADGCPANTVTSTDPANTAATIETWQPCDDGTVVEWVKVAGANHAWMGHPGSRGTEALVGRPYMGFDASAAIWSFVSTHARR